jgi:hypothetical protein
MLSVVTTERAHDELRLDLDSWRARALGGRWPPGWKPRSTPIWPPRVGDRRVDPVSVSGPAR